MKILHTSDWHIGKKLYDKPLDETLKHFFRWLEQTIINEKIDILIVAGDIFNSPFPSSSALSLYYSTLYELSSTNLQHIILIGGNHDSISTLNAPKDLLNELNITVVGGYTGKIDEMIITLKDDQNKTKAVICAVPFLKERDVRTSISGNDFKQRISQVTQGIKQLYAQVADVVEPYKQQNIPIIATGHLFVNNTTETKQNEEQPFVGGLQQIAINQLPQTFDYIALGHIHKPYKIGKQQNIRYSGSPIHLSFSENKNKSQVVVVQFDTEIKIKPIYVPIFRNLIRINGTLKEVKEKIANFKQTKPLKTWAEITIIEEKQDPMIEKKIMQLKNTTQHIEIINFKYQFTEIEENIRQKFSENTELKDLDPKKIFATLLENYSENEIEELKETFMELINNNQE